MILLTKAIVEYLETQGIGVFGTDIFIGTRPPKPINCLTLYDTGGFKPKKDTTSNPTFQIIGRHKSYVDGFANIKEAHNHLKEKYNFWLKENKIWVLLLEAQGEPGKIGKEKDNYLFSCNYHLWLKYY